MFCLFLGVMYPPIEKGQMPSAPPPYSESQNFQQTGYPPQIPPNQMGQPTQVIVVQGPAPSKYLIFVSYFVNRFYYVIYLFIYCINANR